ncbi:hypothetical protein Y032_0228g2872 [Ancylostoma ceylanicum]|uniref:Uncharacterized protein n=1 Tax=Ancylostoma ceylanicum TaxID=53326 RepID=A0A016SH98_9BILA|nr:hypothetical protein Y032_0228g2872 [Ancylostoma ceylanicum]
MMTGSEKELFVEQGAFLEVHGQQLKVGEFHCVSLCTEGKGVTGSSRKAPRLSRPHHRQPYLRHPGSATATSSQLERRRGAAWCQNQLRHRQTHRPRAHLVLRDITKLSYFHPISSNTALTID